MRLAVVTARGGSKRIPRKNIRPFCGQPIIVYSIQAARLSGCFDEVMVSTDDAEIAEVARSHGAVVPFMRSAATAGDHATTADVLLEVLHAYAKRDRAVDISCCLYPTAPFVTPDILQSGLRMLDAEPTLAGVIPVTRFSHPIQRALRVSNGRVSMFQPEHLRSRSQDLEPAYHDAGQFYWIRVADFLATPSLMAERTGALVLPEWQVHDIDNEDDWLLAEMKYQILLERRGLGQAC